jgi:ElaB/YqjD/DUF883 family membrane-anchored ribosome-binding protein
VGEDPDRIRQQIEQTRAEMGDTVDALGYKTDVKARAKDSLTETKDSAKESVMGVTRSVKEKIAGATDSVGEATPDREQVAQQARRAKGMAQENPLGLAIGSVAVGFVAGLLLPSSRIEDERLGPVADDVKERVRQTGEEALERGKDVAQEVAQSAQETASEAGQRHGEELRDTAQQHAQEAASGAQERVSG